MDKNYNDELFQIKIELEEVKAELAYFKQALYEFPNAIFIVNEDGEIIFKNKRYTNFFASHSIKEDNNDEDGYYFSDIRSMSESKYEGDEENDIGFLLREGGEVDRTRVYISPKGKEITCIYQLAEFEDNETGEQGIIGGILDITEEAKLRAEVEKKSQKLKETIQELSENEKRLKTANRELFEAKTKLEYAFKTDQGTGLYNRYAFDNIVSSLFEQCAKYNRNLSIVMADLDHFKRVNDTFGHLEGDIVLKKFGHLLSTQIRTGDIAIRYGGEEFLIFLPDANEKDAAMIAERIREATKQKIFLPDGSNMTVSLGVTKCHPNEDKETYLARVDGALYNAKNTGRDKTVVQCSRKTKQELLTRNN